MTNEERATDISEVKGDFGKAEQQPVKAPLIETIYEDRLYVTAYCLLFCSY